MFRNKSVKRCERLVNVVVKAVNDWFMCPEGQSSSHLTLDLWQSPFFLRISLKMEA